MVDSGRAARLKRKQHEQNSVANPKRRKSTEEDSEPNIQDELLLVESQILSSRSNYNKIAALLKYSQSSGSQIQLCHTAAVVLCRVFCRLMARGSISKSNETSENETIVVQWLRKQLEEYEKTLLTMLSTTNKALQSLALSLSLRILKEKADHLRLQGNLIWGSGLFQSVVKSLVQPETFGETRIEYVERYFDQYTDIRHYTFKILAFVIDF